MQFRTRTPDWIGISLATLVVMMVSSVTGRAQEYTFTDVTDAAGVANGDRGHFGVSWYDVDGDGLLDLYLANGGSSTPHQPEDVNTLYLNNGDGTFTDITSETGTGDDWFAMRNVFADYDNDGDADFYSHNFLQSTLYQNNGNVWFDVNESSGAGLQVSNGTGAAWGDYDNDGWLDLAATEHPTGENVLLHSNGDGTFTNLQRESGLPFNADAMGNAWIDYDRDGDLDLSAAAVTPSDPNFLFRNNGDGTFSRATTDAGIIVEAGSSTAAITWGDYDNDTWPDLVITEVGLGSQKVLPIRVYLFRNNGDGTFQDVTEAAGIVMPSRVFEIWEAAFGDYDNDGDLDLYLGAEGPNMLFQNNGDGTFVDIAPDLGIDFDPEGKGAAWGDYDNDGDLDLYVLQRVEDRRRLIPNLLLRNEGGSNNWLQVELVGTCSNRDGIGTQIVLRAGATRQYRELQGGSGFFSQQSPVQQFGLGAETRVSRIAVRWPSGQRQSVAAVDANQRIVITERGC